MSKASSAANSRPEEARAAPFDSTAQDHVLVKLLGLLILVAAFVFMALWTWRGWNDPLIDFGQTLYVAWRLAEGDVLSRDIAYMFGPLSAYLNGVLFRLFGPALMHLALFNAAIAGIVIMELHVLLRVIAGRASAMAGCLVFIVMFGFAQYTRLANYNFITPYTPEATQGFALSLLSLCLLHWNARRPRQVLMVLAGMSWGAVFLTKPELFLAATCAVAAYFAVQWRQWGSGQARSEALGQFAIGSFVLPVAFLLMFKTSMPWSAALHATSGAWAHVFKTQLSGLPFYQRSMGLDDVSGNLSAMFTWTAVLCAIMAVPFVVSLRMPRGFARLLMIGAALCLLTFVPLTVWWQSSWFDAARVLTFTTMMALAVSLIATIRGARQASVTDAIALRLAFVVFAAVLLAKILLRARLYQYGFVMAVPAMMVLVAALLDWIPGWINRRAGTGPIFQLAAVGLLSAVAVQAVRVTGQLHDLKRFRMGEGADAFVADERGKILSQAVQWLSQETPPNATLIVLPEGVMLNYLARRANPTPYVSFLPSDFAAFGEPSILGALQAHPPDLIAIVHRDSSELGARFFGRDYGTDIIRWVSEQYHPVITFGSPPLVDESFGVLIMARGPSS